MSSDDDRALVERALAVSDQRLSEGMLYRHLAAAVSRLLTENERLRETEKLYDRLVPELAQRQKVIDAAAKHWLALEPGIAWEGGLDAAMAAACAEIEALRADKERLEYLIEHRSSIAAHSTDAGGTVWAVGPHAEIVSARDCHATLRAAIYAAMEIAEPHTSSGLEVAK